MPTVIKNIVGEVFGDLTVIGENREQSVLRAVCLCSCGNEYLVQYNRLTRGLVTQCKVCKREKGARRSPDMSDDAEGSTSHTLVFTGNARTEGVRQYYCTCTVCGKSSWYTKRLFRLGYAKCDCERMRSARKHFIELLHSYRVMKFPVRHDEVPALCIAHKQRTSTTLSSFGVKFKDTAGMRLHSLMSSSVNDNTFPTADYSEYGSLSSGEDITMKYVVRCFSPLLYSLLYEHQAISSIDADRCFRVMENAKQEDILSFLDYRCFVEHLIPCEFRSEKFMYVDCDDAYLCLRFDPRLLSLRLVRNEIPMLTMRVFPKSSGFRFTDEFVRSFMHWFCASFLQTDISSLPNDEVMFYMEVTMPEVWFSDVTCMHMTERKSAIRKYPVWLRHDCIVRERVFSQIGFSLRSLLALMYPDMHESYVRTSAACDVITGMMKKLGFVLAQEFQCASYTLDVTPRFVFGI